MNSLTTASPILAKWPRLTAPARRIKHLLEYFKYLYLKYLPADCIDIYLYLRLLTACLRLAIFSADLWL